MSEMTLLLCGAAVSFIFAAGCYAYMRQRLLPERGVAAVQEALRSAELHIVKSDSEVPA